ncbi:MAG TPA: YceD family protein [Rhodocyclaceae bacterium]
MSRQHLQDLAGTVFDGMAFARDSGRMTGHVALAKLTRVMDQLLDSSGDLSCELSGERDGEGSFLLLEASGEVVLRCQRCLNAMRLPLQISARLRLIAPRRDGTLDWPEDELEDDSADAIVAGPEMSVLALVEDEVLLALPIAPMHKEQDAACKPLTDADLNREASPFAVLAKLKKQ